MGKEADRQKYIHNFARTLLGQLKDKIDLWRFSYYDDARSIAVDLYWSKDSFAHVVHRLREQSDETLGKLACAGLGRGDSSPPGAIQLHQVSNSVLFSPRVPKWFSIEKSGRDIVLYLAAQAVCAAMADNISADVQKVKYSPRHDYSKVGLPV